MDGFRPDRDSWCKKACQPSYDSRTTGSQETGLLVSASPAMSNMQRRLDTDVPSKTKTRTYVGNTGLGDILQNGRNQAFSVCTLTPASFAV
jgi:hypothetical protein